MKKLLLIAFAAFSLAACNSEDKKAGVTQSTLSAGADSLASTSIQWIDSTVLDLGKVKEGTVVEVSYRFKNSGNKNLVIQDVTAACGCTVPEKPEQPYAPGEEGVIRAKFDSRGRLGTNEKYVTVTSNTSPSNQQMLRFKVEVIK